MTKNRRMKLAFSLLLSLLIGFSTVESAFAAEPLGKIPTTVQDPQDVSFAKPRTAPVELLKDRTETSKRMLNPDGSFTEKIYAEPIHYKDPSTGKWTDIDSSLVQGTDGAFRNKANSFSVKLNQAANGGYVDFTADGATVSFLPSFAGAIQGKVNKNSILYANVATDADLTYAVESKGLKESVVLKSANAPNTYSYQLKMQGVTYKTNADGSLSFFKNGADKPVFQLAKPFMFDAKGQISQGVTYQVQQGAGGTYTLNVTADEGWLSDPQRSYPVTIDPTITILNGGNVDDTFISLLNPNTVYSNYAHNYVGQATNFGTTRALYWFNLASSLPSGAVISSATLNVDNTTEYVTNQYPTIEAHRITSNWTGASTDWNDAPTIGGIDGTLSPPNTTPMTWNIPITGLVEDWYNGVQSNYGVELKFSDESLVCRELLAVDDTTDPGNHPALVVNYAVDGYGQQPFWTFDGQVNVANRNLTFTETDVNFPGRGVGLSFGRTYNSRNKSSNLLGYGWNSPLDVHLYVPAAGPARLVDAGGTTHFFAENTDGTYSSPPGLYWNLSFTNSSTAVVTLTDGMQYTFVNGNLSSIQDAAGNKVTYNRNSSGQVTSITDAAGHSVTFCYYSNGKLYYVNDPSGNMTYYGFDASGNMFKVTAPDGSVTLYRYDANHNITAIVSPTGKITYYAYTADNRIAAVNPLNAVTNSNFEVDSDGDGLPDHFSYSSGQTGQASFDSNAGSSYGQAFKLNAASTNASTYTVFLSDPIPADPSCTYTLSGYLKGGQTSSGTTVLSLIALDANNNSLGEFGRTALTGTFGWQRVTSTLAANAMPTGTVNVEVKVGVSSSSGLGSSWFDAVQLEENASVSAYASGDQYTASSTSSMSSHYDGEGHKRLYTYNDSQNVTKFQADPQGQNLSESFGWDTSIPNTLSSYTDANNNTWTYAHESASGNMIKITDPNSNTSSYAWDGKANLTQYTSPNGDNYNNTFDDNSNNTSNKDPYGSGTAQTHDSYANVAKETGKLGQADNLVDNSSFEEGTNADGTPIDFGFSVGQPNTWSIAPDAVQGSKSEAITSSSTNASNFTVNLSNMVQVDITSDYLLAGWMKATENTAGTQNSVLSVYCYDSNGNNLGEVGRMAVIGAAGWQRWAKVIHASDFPAGTTQVKLKTAALNSSSNGTSYFDAVQLQKNPIDTGYNLLDNPSFERGSSWPIGWTQPPTGQWVTSPVFVGSRALAIVKPSTYQAIATTRYLPYDSSKTYSLTAYYKGTGLGTSNWIANIKIEEYDANYNLLASVAVPNQADSDWKFLSTELPQGTASTGTTYIRPVLDTGSTSTGTVYFDDVRLQEGSLTTLYSYDSSNTWATKKTDPLGNVTTYAFDASGNTTQQTDPLGNVTTSSYDSMGRLLSSLTPGSDLKTSYTYDMDGNVNSIANTDSTGSTTYSQVNFTYNNMDQPDTVSDPLGRKTMFLYSAAGRIQEVDKPNGNTVSSSYDKADRLTELYFNGTDRYRFAYDADGNPTTKTDLLNNRTWTATYDKLGSLSSWADGGNKVSYTHDNNGNVTQEQFTVGTVTKTQKQNFNKVDQMNSLVDADGNTSQFLFNESGALSMIQSGNGVTERYSYDAAGRPTLVQNEISSGTVLASYTYGDANGQNGYDADGHILNITDNNGKTLTYAYTARGQLQSETLPNGHIVKYTYDPQGNQTQRQEFQSDGVTVVSTTTYAYDKANELTSINGTTLSYDANGNLTSNGTYTYKWDAGNRLTEVDNASTGQTVATFQYDSDGRRVQQTINGQVTNFLYDGKSNRVLAEYDGSNNLIKYYTWGPTGQLLSLTVNGTTYYTVRNAHGDIVQLTDSSGKTTDSNGNVYGSYTYDAWGNITNITGTVASQNPYRYANYRYDDSIGLYYLNGRYYNPSIGRFLSLDPHTMLPDYTYASNNPLSFVDPSGHWLLDAIFLVMDTASFISNPSIEGGAFIAVDLISIAIPVGSISIFAHAAEAVDEAAHAVDAVREIGQADRIATNATRAARLLDEGAHAGDGVTTSLRSHASAPSFHSGYDGERFLGNMVGANKGTLRETPLTQKRRYIDRLAPNNIAHESKVGYARASEFIKEQIRKDVELRDQKVVDGVHWHFFRSAKTGKIGPSDELARLLEENGIPYTIYDL